MNVARNEINAFNKGIVKVTNAMRHNSNDNRHLKMAEVVFSEK
jgi:uncharacterized protein YegL